MIERHVGDEVKFMVWEVGKIVAIQGDKAIIEDKNGVQYERALTLVRTNKHIPKNIDVWADKYRVRINGAHYGLYDTIEEAVKARDEILADKGRITILNKVDAPEVREALNA